MTDSRKSNYAIRRTPEPFDFLDRWEVIELNRWKFSRDPHAHVSNHVSKRGALKRLRKIEANQAHPETTTSAAIPLADLRRAR